MSDIFSIEHYFVVFHPGAGGNFLTGLIKKLISGEYSPLHVSTTGSSHTTIQIKNTNLDLSCGTFVDDLPTFDSVEDKVSYYRQQFSTSPISTSQVSWTHDFTNIPVYRQLFPNSKVLVVTQESMTEKFVITILQELKNILDPSVNSVVTKEKNQEYVERWKKRAFEEISLISSNEVAEKIVNDRFNVDYRSIVEYVTLKRAMRYYQLSRFLDYPNLSSVDTVNYVLWPNIGNTRTPYLPYDIIGPYSDFVDSDCVKLPYEFIRTNNSEKLVSTLSELLGTLNAEQVDFVTDTLTSYYSNQKREVLEDPIGYYSSLMANANNLVKTL